MTLQIAEPITEQTGEPGGEPIAGQADGPDGGSVRHAALVKLLCLLALAAVATVAVWYFSTAAGAAGGCGGG